MSSSSQCGAISFSTHFSHSAASGFTSARFFNTREMPPALTSYFSASFSCNASENSPSNLCFSTLFFQMTRRWDSVSLSNRIE